MEIPSVAREELHEMSYKIVSAPVVNDQSHTIELYLAPSYLMAAVRGCCQATLSSSADGTASIRWPLSEPQGRLGRRSPDRRLEPSRQSLCGPTIREDGLKMECTHRATSESLVADKALSRRVITARQLSQTERRCRLRKPYCMYERR